MKTKIVNTEIYRHKSEHGTVALKTRKNGNNPVSLYLEIYEKTNQKRHLEFLNIHLSGDESLDKQLKIDGIAKCTNYEFSYKKAAMPSFTDYIKEQIALIDKPQSRKQGFSALARLHSYSHMDNVLFSRIDEKYLLGFRNWLLNEAENERGGFLGKGTADNYLNSIMRYANRAKKKGFISAAIHWDIPPIGKVISVPITLTEEEIKALQSTPYPNVPEICKALMLQFACGQRWGDIKDMTWEQIVSEGEVYKIVLQQEKTDKVLPSFITASLIDWIGEGKERQGKIFIKIPKDCQTVREHLQEWCKQAGIEKKVGTHTMRRSCATILYKKGVPLYTISKILGHSSSDITLRYIGIDEKDIKDGLDALKDITNSFNYSKAC